MRPATTSPFSSLLVSLLLLHASVPLPAARAAVSSDACPREALRPQWHARPPSGVLSDICGTIYLDNSNNSHGAEDHGDNSRDDTRDSSEGNSKTSSHGSNCSSDTSSHCSSDNNSHTSTQNTKASDVHPFTAAAAAAHAGHRAAGPTPGGRYHLFHQHNEPTRGETAMRWYHLSSPDLVSWRQEGVALLPNETYSAHGAWDGSLSVIGGRVRLLYSCLPANGSNMLCAATPTDASLTGFVEYAGNPVVRDAPPGSNMFDFRDPTAMFLPPGAAPGTLGSIAAGSSLGTGPSGAATRNGSVVTYRVLNPNLTELAYDGVLFTTARFGPPVLECPDFFPLPGSDAAKAPGSSTATHVLRFSAEPCLDTYLIGQYSGGPNFQANDSLVRLSDGGLFCASRTLVAPAAPGAAGSARRILFGAVNCDTDAIRSSAACDFCGVASAPRELAHDPADASRLLVQPASELQALRRRLLYNATAQRLSPTPLPMVARGLSLEVAAEFACPAGVAAGDRGFRVRIRARDEAAFAEVAVDWLQRATLSNTSLPGEDFGFEAVAASLPPDRVPDACDAACWRSPACVAWTYAAPPDAPTPRCLLKRTVPPQVVQAGAVSGIIDSRYMAIRRAGAVLPNDTPDRIARLPWQSPDGATTASLRVFLDRTIIEAFADGMAMSARFYPDVAADGVTFAAPAATLLNATVWQLP